MSAQGNSGGAGPSGLECLFGSAGGSHAADIEFRLDALVAALDVALNGINWHYKRPSPSSPVNDYPFPVEELECAVSSILVRLHTAVLEDDDGLGALSYEVLRIETGLDSEMFVYALNVIFNKRCD